MNQLINNQLVFRYIYSPVLHHWIDDGQKTKGFYFNVLKILDLLGFEDC